MILSLDFGNVTFGRQGLTGWSIDLILLDSSAH